MLPTLLRACAISAITVPLLLGAPALASADEGRCMAIFGAGFAWEPGVLDSVDPVELESPDPDARPLEAPLSVADALACAGTDDVR